MTGREADEIKILRSMLGERLENATSCGLRVVCRKDCRDDRYAEGARPQDVRDTRCRDAADRKDGNAAPVAGLLKRTQPDGSAVVSFGWCVVDRTEHREISTLSSCSDRFFGAM